MAVHRFEVNGVVHRVEAPTKEAAEAELNRLMEASPEAFKRPGVQAAMLQVLRETQNDPSGRAINAATLGLSDLMESAVRAGATGTANVFRGNKRPYAAGDMFTAMQLYNAAKREQELKEHPVSAIAADVLGGMAMPGASKVAGFVAGKTAPALMQAGLKIPKTVRAAQLGRGALAGAGLMGAQNATTAPTADDVASRAKSGAATGAVVGPLADIAVGAGAKVLKAAGEAAEPLVGAFLRTAAKSDMYTDTARSLVNKYFPAKTAVTRAKENVMRRLAIALQREGLSVDTIEAALNAASASGGITPNVLDVLVKAKAGPNIVKLVGGMSRDPATRRAVETYVERAVQSAPKKALQVTEQTLGARPTPTSQLRSSAEAQAQAGRVAPPAATPREQGAAAFVDEMNTQADALHSAYKDRFSAYDAAHPESVVVEDEQRAPLITNVLSKAGIDDNSPDGRKLLREIEGLREGYVYPVGEGEEPETAGSRPLTFAQLRNLEQRLGDEAQTLTGNAQRQYLDAQRAIREEMVRIADQGHLLGDDPDMVNNLREGVKLFAAFKDRFGSGLGAKLTAREPSGDPNVLGAPAVKPYQAADLIFGSGENPRSLNNILSDLEPLLGGNQALGKPTDPAAVRALKEEMYTRAVSPNPEEVASQISGLTQRFPTAAKELLPADLVQGAQTAAAQTAAAQTAAENAKQALALGEKVLPSESAPAADYVAEVSGLTPSNQALQRAAAQQAITTRVGVTKPENLDAFAGQLGSEEAQQKLGATFGPQKAETYAARMTDVAQQLKNARLLEQITRPKLGDVSLPETLSTDLAYERKGVQAILNNLLRGLDPNKLSPEEAQALLKVLTSEGGVELPGLAATQRKTGRSQLYPRVAPTVARTAPGIVKTDDDLDRLKQAYGIGIFVEDPTTGKDIPAEEFLAQKRKAP